MIPVFRPSVSDAEVEAVADVLRSGWWGLGPKTREFEEKFAQYVGAKHAIALNSGTAALHLALRVPSIGRGDEVITTPMTFVSTNHAILYNNATPVFADIEEDTLNIDPTDIERKITPKTKAIIMVHYGGHPCDIDEIHELAKDRGGGIKVIEDAAHACGAEYKGKKIGSLSDATCFSFHPVKNLATGDGGMITMDDDDAAARLQKLRWVGISRGTWDRTESKGYSWEYNVEELGFKYHMNDIIAAIGLAQLARLEQMNARRRELAMRYTEALSDIEWIETPVEKDYVRSACHNYVIKVADPSDRDPLMDHLKAKGISTGMHYIPNHLYAMYKPYASHLSVAEKVWKRLITLPLYPDLNPEEQGKVIAAIKSYKR